MRCSLHSLTTYRCWDVQPRNIRSGALPIAAAPLLRCGGPVHACGATVSSWDLLSCSTTSRICIAPARRLNCRLGSHQPTGVPDVTRMLCRQRVFGFCGMRRGRKGAHRRGNHGAGAVSCHFITALTVPSPCAGRKRGKYPRYCTDTVAGIMTAQSFESKTDRSAPTLIGSRRAQITLPECDTIYLSSHSIVAPPCLSTRKLSCRA